MNRWISLGALVMAIAALIMVSFKGDEQLTVVYMKAEEVIEKFEGMKEARVVFNGKKEAWQANLDTLQADFQRAVSKYNLDTPRLTKEEKEAREELLAKQEQNYRQYKNVLDRKYEEENQRMTEAVLTQIDAFLKLYAKEKGYDYILNGTGGGVLYGQESKDITEEILPALNNYYLNGELKN